MLIKGFNSLFEQSCGELFHTHSVYAHTHTHTLFYLPTPHTTVTYVNVVTGVFSHSIAVNLIRTHSLITVCLHSFRTALLHYILQLYTVRQNKMSRPPSWILTPKCKKAIFSKAKHFRAMVSIDDL